MLLLLPFVVSFIFHVRVKLKGESPWKLINAGRWLNKLLIESVLAYLNDISLRSSPERQQVRVQQVKRIDRTRLS